MSKRAKSFVASCLVLGMCLGLASRADADWDNNSGSLPGIMSGKKLAIVGAAAGAGVVTIYWLKHKSKKAKTADPSPAAVTRVTPQSTDDLVRELRSSAVGHVWRLGRH